MSQSDSWKTYPENLNHLRGCYAYGYDFTAYNARLKEESERLFVRENEAISIQVIDLGESCQRLKTNDALDQYLESTIRSSKTRIILIYQQGSWGRLTINETGIRKLLSSFEVFPSFLDWLSAFGQKTSFDDDSYGGFRFRMGEPSCSQEISYLVKHVDKHGRSEPSEKWSVRQMALYHQNSRLLGDTFMILNPSATLQARFKQLEELQATPTPWELHSIVLSCAMERWRYYVSDIESRYLRIKTKAQLTRVDDSVNENDLMMGDLRLEDTQDIQVLQDKCQNLFHFLEIDRSILRNIMDQVSGEGEGSLGIKGDSGFIISLVEDVDIQMSRVNNILKRLDGTVALIRTILDLKCLSSTQRNTTSMTKMTELSQVENRLMIGLTKKAARDTDIMKTLALLGLIYLPASLVASVMGMRYISVDGSNSTIAFHFSGEFWIFLVAAAVLMAITLGIYYVWIYRRQKRDNTGGASKLQC